MSQLYAVVCFGGALASHRSGAPVLVASGDLADEFYLALKASLPS